MFINGGTDTLKTDMNELNTVIVRVVLCSINLNYLVLQSIKTTEILHHLRKPICRKWPDLWKDNLCKYHLNNGPAYITACSGIVEKT